MLRQKAINFENRISNKDSDEFEETELFLKKNLYKEIETVEKEIEEGDTLQALSIRYHCPISELKRLNNIHKENEIYAKRTIKVPVRIHTMPLIQFSGNNSPNLDNEEPHEIDEKIVEAKLKDAIINSQKNDVNSLIFNSNIASKSCDITDDVIEEIYDEEVHLIPNEVMPVQPPVVSRLTCSGADADISWIALVICIGIVIFAIPLIYTLYIAEHPGSFHHNENNV